MILTHPKKKKKMIHIHCTKHDATTRERKKRMKQKPHMEIISIRAHNSISQEKQKI